MTKDYISGQSPDVLVYLCNFLDTKTLMRIRHVSKLFNLIISNRVSLTFNITDFAIGLQHM